MAKTFYLASANREVFVSPIGTQFLIDEGAIEADDELMEPEDARFLKNLTLPRAGSILQECTEDEYMNRRATYALNNPHSALIAQIREQLRQEDQARTDQKGVSTSAQVNNPNAGVVVGQAGTNAEVSAGGVAAILEAAKANAATTEQKK